MKVLLVLIFFTLSTMALAGGFRFPNVPFSYAKLYFFNINLDQPNHVDYRIFEEGMYAKSKLGNGFLLSPNFHTQLLDIFKHRPDELVIGLSICFMPRHGIIYYNAQHEPVASLSICFECDKIAIWSLDPIHFNENLPHFNPKTAERQLAELAALLKAENIPVYTDPADEKKYLNAIQMNGMPANLAIERLELTDSVLNLPQKFTPQEVENWLFPKSRSRFSALRDSLLNGQSSFEKYQTLRYTAESQFLFLNGELVEATITNADLKLPFLIQLGMSLDELNYSLKLAPTDEKRFLEIILITTETWSIELDVHYQTLRKLVLRKNG